jgi:hypothetical protein
MITGAMRRFTHAVLLCSLLLPACAGRPQLEAGCATAPLALSQIPQLGDLLSSPGPTCTRILSSSAQTWPSYEAKVNGIAFTIGIDHDARVRYISTRDHSFASPEGLHAGDPAATATKAASNATIMDERGWGHYILLPSGWYALLEDTFIDADGHVQMNLGMRELRSDATIAMFFRR